MKKILLCMSILGLTLLGIGGCQKEKSSEITVSAAASLKDSLGQVIEKFEKDNPNIKINVNFGGSGALKNQIIAGAPVDLVFFASQKDLNDLKDKNMVDEKYNKNLLKNRLVVAGRREINDLLDIVNDKIAIGTPETVPAGRYAKEVFTNLGIWNAIQKNLVFTKDVRSAAQYVDLGEVDYAIIYKTDAKILKNASISYLIPENLHKPIVYSYGIIKEHANSPTIKFYEFLQSKEAEKIYQKYNFELAE